MLVVAEVVTGEEFCGENDLGGVLGEVFDDVVDSFEDIDVVVLRLDSFEQTRVGKLFENREGAVYGVVEFSEQGAFLDTAAGRKFGVALPVVGESADAMADPLADVAAKVQDKVADGVFVLVIAQPDLVAGEAADAVVNAIRSWPSVSPENFRKASSITRLLPTSFRGWISPWR